MEKEIKGNLLVIDDNLANSRMIEDTLLPLGFQIFVVQNDTLAFSKLKTVRFDLVVVDSQFQNQSGVQICDKIKSLEENKNIPVIIITPSSDKANINRIVESAASDYLIRPFTRNELISRISPYIELSYLKKQNEKNSEQISENIAKKNEFLILMGHAIRTQLNSILNAVELINDSDLSENQRECVNIINSSTESLIELIKDVMDYSRIESGTIILETVSFELPKTIEEVVHGFDEAAKVKNIDLSIHYEGQSPYIVYGDQKRFSQVLNSLVSNAVKYTTKGGVKVIVRQPKTISERKSKMVFEVIDTGIGISKEGISQLFQTFSNIDSQIKNNQFEGNGLELVIAKRLVELMGGEIGVRSQLGEGSTFWFSVDFEVFKGSSTQNVKPIETESPGVFKPLKVLLVEDNPINNKVAVFALQKLGHKVDSVLNGMDAVNKFQPGLYDVVMMDISMPLMDGFETTQRIRAIESAADQPLNPVRIIAMTANTVKGDREKCFEAGMDEYISKPFRLEDLIRILQ